MYLVFYILGIIAGGILVFVFTRKRDICGELHIIQEKNEEPKLFISIKDIDSIRNKHIVEFIVGFSSNSFTNGAIFIASGLVPNIVINHVYLPF